MSTGYDPAGPIYTNHEGFPFAIREAAGQFTFRVFATVDIVRTGLVAVATAHPASLIYPGFLLFLSIGLILFAIV
ncbi:MAG: hypothetical protein L3K17_06330 [Thermoplasmata archaeon]|nr:hypothetical protein [Thermoplasmata archaeon]